MAEVTLGMRGIETAGELVLITGTWEPVPATLVLGIGIATEL